MENWTIICVTLLAVVIVFKLLWRRRSARPATNKGIVRGGSRYLGLSERYVHTLGKIHEYGQVNMSIMLRFDKNITKKNLEMTLIELQAMYAILNTRIVQKAKGFYMEVVDSCPPIPVMTKTRRVADSKLSAEQEEAAHREWCQAQLVAEVNTAFDNSTPPLMRATILEKQGPSSSSAQHVIFTIHHTLMDGSSFSILTFEALAIYSRVASENKETMTITTTTATTTATATTEPSTALSSSITSAKPMVPISPSFNDMFESAVFPLPLRAVLALVRIVFNLKFGFGIPLKLPFSSNPSLRDMSKNPTWETGGVFRYLSEEDSKRFIQKCKSNNTTVGCGIFTCLSTTVAELYGKDSARVWGHMTIDTKKYLMHKDIKSGTKFDWRGTFGATMSTISHFADVKSSAENREHFWELARQCKKSVQSSVMMGEPLGNCLVVNWGMPYAKYHNTSFTMPMLTPAFILSNMGEIDWSAALESLENPSNPSPPQPQANNIKRQHSILLGSIMDDIMTTHRACKDTFPHIIEATPLVNSCMAFPFYTVLTGSVRGRLSVTFVYCKNSISDDDAQRFADTCIQKILNL